MSWKTVNQSVPARTVKSSGALKSNIYRSPKTSYTPNIINIPNVSPNVFNVPNASNTLHVAPGDSTSTTKKQV